METLLWHVPYLSQCISSMCYYQMLLYYYQLCDEGLRTNRMWINKFQLKYKETRSVKTQFGPTDENDSGYKVLH